MKNRKQNKKGRDIKELREPQRAVGDEMRHWWPEEERTVSWVT